MFKAVPYLLTVSLMTAPLTVFALTSVSISTSNSLKFTGEAENTSAGTSATVIGDINADGYTDWLVGGYSDTNSRDDAYLVYGSATRTSAVGILKLDSSAGEIAEFQGAAPDGYSGAIVGAAGDVDGDGYADFLVGAPFQSSVKGQVYLVYGQSAAFSTTQSLSTTGITFTGETAGDYLGYALASADLNNDGYSDLLLGSRTNDGGKGALYIIYGQASRFTSASITSVMDYKLKGANANDNFGSALAGGDINADGYEDVLIGAPRYSTYTGAAYILYGTAVQQSGTATVDTTSVPAFIGEQTYDSIGTSLAFVPDVDGDGYNEAFIGSSEQATGDTITDGSYLVYGQADKYTGTANASALPKFTIEAAADNVSYSVNGGDVDLDGYGDLIMGYSGYSSNAGAVYIFTGGSDRFVSTMSATLADYRLVGGVANGSFGNVVRGFYNNGDGAVDLLVSSNVDNSSFNNAGSVSVIRVFIDSDDDGTPGGSGLAAGSDCSDSDATVSANQTYYLDADGDGLGVADTTTSVCSSTAPEGYADNADDTDDSIQNNGLEIADDGVDNDGDGTTDEVNTTTENGEHPEYGAGDVTSGTVYDASIIDIQGTVDGDILVTYADNSIYQYNVYNINSTANTKVAVKPNSSLVVVLHPKMKKAALVNALSGEVYQRKRLNTVSFAQNKLLIKDLRSDNKYEAIVVGRRQQRIIKTHVISIKVNRLKLKKRDALTIHHRKIRPSKTKARRNIIKLRKQNGTVVVRLRVGRRYSLTQL